jgi:hypothetical protein
LAEVIGRAARPAMKAAAIEVFTVFMMYALLIWLIEVVSDEDANNHERIAS